MIVIVDDNRNIGEGLKGVLGEDGYMVDTLNNGSELYAYLKEKPAHVIVLDIMMPEKDGIEVLSKIKGEWKNIKVIIYSGHPEYEHPAYAKKADMFVLKGGNPQILLDAIEKVLR